MAGAASERTKPQAPSPTRERILKAAARLFARNGFNGTSIRMIARDLGISDPAIHYHFPTKQSLYEALLVPPDYGPTRAADGPVHRDAIIEEALEMFEWWAARPEFGQMLLREQLASEAASLTFMSSSDDAWDGAVTQPLIALYGEAGRDVSALLFEMLAGVFWDAILSYGDRAGETMTQTFFLNRVREMVALAIPPAVEASR